VATIVSVLPLPKMSESVLPLGGCASNSSNNNTASIVTPPEEEEVHPLYSKKSTFSVVPLRQYKL